MTTSDRYAAINKLEMPSPIVPRSGGKQPVVSPTMNKGNTLATPLKHQHYSRATPWTESTMIDDRSWVESVDTPVPTERVSLLTITPAERFYPVVHDAATVASVQDDYHSLVNSLRQQCIGEQEQIPCPLDGTTRRLIYCDYTASGRALESVEDFIANQVCPMYANTHSVASATARQTAHFREEARDRVKTYFNCSDEDSAIFCGAGATGAIRKFEDMLIKSRVFAPPCREKKLRRAVVVVDPVAHHSSLLPFRELTRLYPLGKGVKSRAVTGSHVDVSKSQASPEFIEIELVLPLDGVKGIASIEALRDTLEQVSIFNRHHGDDYATPVVILSACSNVTGACQDMPTVSTLVHTFRGIIAWDCAAIAAHREVNMNPPTHPEGYIDFAFLSPHKLLGGPGSSGILLCKRKRQTNSIPTICGGGTVEFVSSRGHYYLSDLEEREEAGTPDILGCIRAGAVYHIHTLLGINAIAEDEGRMAAHLEKKLRGNSKIHILGPKDDHHRHGLYVAGILAVSNQVGRYLHYNFVGCVLNDVFGIQARGGCACAGPYGEALLGLGGVNGERFEMTALSTRDMIFKPGFVRVGVHFTMTQEELEYLADAILWIAEKGWMLMPAYEFELSSGEWKHSHRDDVNVMK
ncbi:cysteine desulfurylase, putative [Perkinsus marinus ATCC 50983]|uniref:Cysteine desulfurylase, putative n=1 Tax=Perkinsus marinus (strain ATCC 50983 / TXsc) TaxID=423536 RepID=C5KUQ9_PERM5|nr:cysteine desulfurylase, putative [Perkinsus marinus ATCC 50983]EER11780.1 cysteine desulfurylase, putative [Perkinsus marinus ATCC 50983]|eukprot:XP_002779985.1 cysteine desulfurylase, putative [Perkinsus marinus ATCC 50983]